MTDIRFYHLTRTPLERALPQLLEKAVSGGFRVLLKARDEQTMDRLNALLWTYDPNSFLPHGSRKDGNAAEQPIFLTDGDDNPNQANLLAVTDGTVPADPEAYAR